MVYASGNWAAMVYGLEQSWMYGRVLYYYGIVDEDGVEGVRV